DVRSAVGSRPSGTRFVVTVRRGGRQLDLQVSSRRLRDDLGEQIVGLGVFLETQGLEVELPFRISFKEHREIAGPSAGLVYALTITDMLDPADLASGRVIAATGTIDSSGRVGRIGGIRQKLEGARKQGATLLLAPPEDTLEAGESRVEVRPVKTLEEAVGILRAAS
ncbi:MAG: S16 family serine protease, partial [Actinomycetota bacterium]